MMFPVKHSGHVRGENHGGAKLTEAQVREMRTAYALGGAFYKDLAERYGVSITAVHYAIKGRNWKHLR